MSKSIPERGGVHTAQWFRDHGVNPDHVTGWQATWAGDDSPVVTWDGFLAVTPDDMIALAKAVDLDHGT